MEWEEALLTAWGGEIPPHPAAYYRRQAARARRVAEGVTTQAVKARLLDDARYNDELAAKACIFWPYDYLLEWADQHYSKQYLLNAYLLGAAISKAKISSKCIYCSGSGVGGDLCTSC